MPLCLPWYNAAMRSRRLILCLILITIAAFVLVAGVKLRATPKYDRIQNGMSRDEVIEILGKPDAEDGVFGVSQVARWEAMRGLLVFFLSQAATKTARSSSRQKLQSRGRTSPIAAR
jgi:hypothetical protein